MNGHLDTQPLSIVIIQHVEGAEAVAIGQGIVHCMPNGPYDKFAMAGGHW